MKKQQELKYTFTKANQTYDKELNYKKINKSQTQEKYNHLLTNSTILKIIREYSNLYVDNIEKKYAEILKGLIKEKYFELKNEIESMKQNFNNFKENKNFPEKFDFNHNLQINESIKNLEKSEFSYIFDLNKNNIIDVKAKIKELPKEKYESLKFNVEYSDFYLSVDIDKSFEIFKNNLLDLKISYDLKKLVEEYATNFITRIFELDRLIYVILFYFNFNF